MVTYQELQQRRSTLLSPRKSDKVLQDLSSKAAADSADLHSIATIATRQSVVPNAPSEQASRCMALRSTKASKGYTKPPSACRHQYSRRSGRVKLSTLLGQSPSLFDDRKISVVDKGLTDIDHLPRHFHHVKTLYLSKNCLRSLQGIQQFGALVTLALADNLLDSFDQLGFLLMASQGHTLRALSLEGNPIARLPNYRAHVVAQLPGLQMLDGRAVGPEEPQQAVQTLRHEEVLMALMLSNACLVHKLSMAVQLQRVHAELKASVWGTWRQHLTEPTAPVPAPSVTRLVEMWDYEASLTIQERKAIRQALSREVARMQRTAAFKAASLTARQRQSWEEAFAQVMLAQQESIAQLMSLYEAVSMESQGPEASQPHLQAVKQESSKGKACLKQDREALIQELRGNMYGLLDAFKGDFSQQAEHYERRMRQLQTNLQGQLATVSLPERHQHSGSVDAGGGERMARAAASLPDDDNSKVHSRSCSRGRSRSCSRSRHHFPEPQPASLAWGSPSWPPSQMPLQKAVSKSPRGMSHSPSAVWRSPGAAWRSPRAAEAKTPHTVSRSLKDFGMKAAAPDNSAVGSDAKRMSAEDRDQRPGRSASLARLQRSHRSAATTAQKAPSSLTQGSSQKAGKSQAEGEETQPAKAVHAGKEGVATAPQSASILRRSRSGSAAGSGLPPVTPYHGDLAVEDCLPQRPASSPPVAMLSRAPVTSGCQELPSASLTSTQCPQRQPKLHQQLLQTGSHFWSVQEEQQQEWLLQKQQQEWAMQQQQQEWTIQQQQQQQLQAACNVHQQPVDTSVDCQLQDDLARSPGVTHDNPSSLPASGVHAILPQPQQAVVAAQQLALRALPDFRQYAAAAAVPAVHTDGKQAATAANSNGRHIVPAAIVAAATVRSFAKQAGSCTVQTQMHLHQTPHELVPVKEQQPSSADTVPLVAQQPTLLAAAEGCACEVDEVLQVQKLNVTPHKLPRQLSGNPFAEPASVQQPTEHVTAQHAQRDQHASALGYDAEVTHHAEHIHRPITSAQPLMRLHAPPDVMAEHQLAASCMSATVSTYETATASSRQHIQQASDTQQPSQAAGIAEPSPYHGERPTPSALVSNLTGQTIVGEPQAQVSGAQTSRSLLSDLEVEAVAADAEACLLELQERFSGMPESSFPSQEPPQLSPPREQLHSLARQSLQGQPLDRQSLERQSLERQLAQAEAAFRAEQRQCDALRAQAKQSQGCAMQAQLQLRRSHSRAERLAALVNKADEERRGQQLGRKALQRRMLHAWSTAARHSCHLGLMTAAADNMAYHHSQLRTWKRWTRACALARGLALCRSHTSRNCMAAAYLSWRQHTCEAVQGYATDPDADAVARTHATGYLLSRGCLAWQQWMLHHMRPKAAANHRHLVCKRHAIKVWKEHTSRQSRKWQLQQTAVTHHAGRLTSLAWQCWSIFTEYKKVANSKQRHAAVVHRHGMVRRSWQAWRAFMHMCWHKRAHHNSALQLHDTQLVWRAFSAWLHQHRLFHTWLAVQQQRRLRHHLRRWLANVQAQQHWQCLIRQAAILQHRQHHHFLQHCLASWACLAWQQRQAQHRGARAVSRMRRFKLQRVLLAWHCTTHQLRLRKLRVQLAERQGSLLDVHQQAQQAGKAVQDLQLERARLHQRLERVAEHAKVQVGQLALTNERMQSLQQRNADHQGVLQECQTLRAALLEMETLLAHARSRQAQAEQELAEARSASTDAAAAADQEQEELQRTCVGLQHHLAGRKATMEACTRLLQAACPQSIQGKADEDTHAELDALLAAVLQATTDREKSLTEHVKQQQVDLQALHSAVERGSSDREQQLACLQQVQARLQQAESLIQQQRLTIDRLHGCSGRNSKHTGAVGHMRQSENDYWRSWLQSSAQCTSQKAESPRRTQNSCGSPLFVPSRIMAACTQPGEESTALLHAVGLDAPACGHSSVLGLSASSSRSGRPHQQKQAAGAQQCQTERLSSNGSLVNMKPCAEQSFSADACQSSGCQSCGWQPGTASFGGIAASHYHSCLENLPGS